MDSIVSGKISIATVDIDSDGDITAVKTQSEGSNSNLYWGSGYNSLVQVNSDTFALAYTGAWEDGYISTFTISSDGQTITEVDTVEHDGRNATFNSLVQVDSDTYALAYKGNSEGYISTFDIDSDGDITAVKTRSEGNNLKYGDAPLALESWGKSFVKMDSDTFALAHTDPYSGGHITTFNILSDGNTITELSTLQHDTDYATRGTLLKVGSDTVAIAYYGGGGEDRGGIISTVTIGTGADLISVNKNINTSLSESVSLTDDTAAGISVTIPLTETIGLADSISKTKEIVIPLGETLQVSHSNLIGKTVTQPLSESVALTDSFTKGVGTNLSESITFTDDSSSFKSRIVPLSETISFTDSSGKEIVTNLSESVTLRDGITKKVSADLSETITLSDSTDAGKASTVLLTESITLSDSKPSAPNIVPTANADASVAGFEKLANADSVKIFTIGSKQYAIVTAGTNDNGTVQIIDVSNPANIVATPGMLTDDAFLKLKDAQGVDTFTIGSITYAIVTAFADDGVQIIDVNNPTFITSLATLADTPTLELNGARDVDTFTIGSKTYAIVASVRDKGVQIIDVSDPNNISSKGSATDGDIFTELWNANSVDTFTLTGTYAGTYAIVTAGRDNGVQIIDVSNPTAIVALDAETDGENGFDVLQGPTGVKTFTVASNSTATYAIVTASVDDSVQIIDVSNPTAIVALDAETDDNNDFNIMKDPFDVDVFTLATSTYAIVTSTGDNGVTIIDISDPTDISVVDSLVDSDSFKTCECRCRRCIHDSWKYVCDSYNRGK